MIAHKHATRLAALLMALAVCLCALAQGFAGSLAEAAGGTGVTMEYKTKLFDTSEPISVNILIDEADWQSMLENATAEEYVSCDVEINGTRFSSVGIRPKGNTSLSSIASDPDTDRYSFKLEFDHYVDGQTCYGLDKLILNNNYADATSMKEALVYDMFAFLGADASLYNYARVSVNGEYWGLYLALEAVEESFLLRNYGVNYGQLYKPEGMNIGGGKAGGNGGFSPDNLPNMDGFDLDNLPDMEDFNGEGMPDAGIFSPGDRPDSGGTTDEDGQSGEANLAAGWGGFSGMGSGGANLNYSDDDLDSYSTIWEGEVTDSGKKDHQRVVAALRSISEGEKLEQVMDIDNLLLYMAVHIFSVNEDSLSGAMAHNYYLYESKGALNLIPWDYNLAFGGMNGGDATSMVNSAIDDAFSSTDFFDTLMADDEYLLAYHECLSRLVSEYVNGGGLDAFYTRTRSLIDELVRDDPTAFYTYDEYDQAAQTLYDLVKLRAQSIEAQLDGSISSTDSGRSDSDALIDASAYSLQTMGTMNGSRGGGMGGQGFGGSAQRTFPGSRSGGRSAQTDDTASTDRQRTFPGSPPGGQSAQTDDTASADAQRTFPGNRPNGQSAQTDDTASADAQPDGEQAPPSENAPGNLPAGGSDFEGRQGSGQSASARNNNLLLYGGCMLLMLAALLFARLYRANRR